MSELKPDLEIPCDLDPKIDSLQLSVMNDATLLVEIVSVGSVGPGHVVSLSIESEDLLFSFLLKRKNERTK